MTSDEPGESASSEDMLADVERYYSDKVRRHGPTALGVDWNSSMSQRLRFVQLLKVVDWSGQPIRLHDLGCGYGALLEHLDDRHAQAQLGYVGTDISLPMIEHAKQLWAGHAHARFELAASQLPEVDYTVASGIFNICLDHPRSDWEAYVARTLDRIHASSLRGFAVNFMHPRTLIERPAIAGQVYTADPEQWLGYCIDHLHCDVQCLKNYGLNEFTLLATRGS